MKKIIGHVEYEILDTIAEGGMGTVFKAVERGVNGFEKIVAIKMLLDCYSKDKRFTNRFIDEAKLVANLIHENIVQIYQLDKYQDEYYFVLEYVDGITLYEFMEFHSMSRTKLPVKLAVFIALSVARALVYAHTRYGQDGKPLNIVHCDVCSHNILLTTEGVVKLTDFGVARAGTGKEQAAVSGKLPFMSPEQVNKKKLDFRSDIYSLGVVLFYMLSGGKTCRHLNVAPHEILSQAQNNYIDWSLLPDDLDRGLFGVLRRMLATDPDKRYSSTVKVARKLEQYIVRSGYAPTSFTLAKYMRREMPALFADKPGELENYRRNAGTAAAGSDPAATKRMLWGISETTPGLNKTQSMSEEELAAENLTKTRLMSEDELRASGLVSGEAEVK
ncbi:MAG: serine/threonine-protein kinase [Victivallaceae bacterium]|nr:serine/threonine-protein kinase [Victivallaceae bacterium]